MVQDKHSSKQAIKQAIKQASDIVATAYAVVTKTRIFHKTSLSEYAKSLESHVRKRYIDKILVIGVEPLFIPGGN